MTAYRVTNLYDLMDSAYDAPKIEAKSRALGHVPIIDRHPRSVPGGKEAIAAEACAQRKAGYVHAEDWRTTGHSAAERVKAASRMISVRAMCGCAATPRCSAT
jgi:hypothetical protein